MDIHGKTALVTGGASGLGAATVLALTEAGANVVVADLRECETNPRVRFVKTDVSDAEQAQHAVQTAVEDFGGLHIALNCAGLLLPERVLDKEGNPASLDRFAKVIQVNLVGTFNICRLAAAAMMRNEPNENGERGVLINTASVAAYEGQIGQASYAASKGGIVGLTLPLARDLSRAGIRVMAIAPGLFDTPMLAGLPENVRASLGAMVPFPSRLGQPKEYAMLALHIVQNPMLNGEVIRLDGAIRMAPK